MSNVKLSALRALLQTVYVAQNRLAQVSGSFLLALRLWWQQEGMIEAEVATCGDQFPEWCKAHGANTLDAREETELFGQLSFYLVKAN